MFNTSYKMVELILISILLFVSLVRIWYMKAIIADWNHYLDIYIQRCINNHPHSFIINTDYLKSLFLKTYKYWWRLDCWTIRDIIQDHNIIVEVNNTKIIYKK